MNTKTIALVDGFDDGHHLTHLRNYARALLEMGHRVVELLPNPARVDAWFTENCGPHRARLMLHPFRHSQTAAPFWRLRTIWPPLAAWRHAARTVAEAERRSGWKIDLVFFCWLDDYIVGLSPLCRFALPTLFPYPWSGLFFHPWHLRSPAGDTDAHYAVSTHMLGTRRCRGVAVLDEGIMPALRARLHRPVIQIPDETEERLPVTESDRVRRLRTAIRGRKVIGLVGELSRRKGVVAFLKAAERARDRDWVFLLAGAMGDAQRKSYFPEEWMLVEAILKAPPANVVFMGERVEDEVEFNAVVQLCDALFAAYETFGHSSGILTKAAVFRKPILVSPGYCMAERVARFKIGLAVDPHQTEAVVDALATLLNPADFARRVGVADFAGCHREHSIDALPSAMERVVALTEI